MALENVSRGRGERPIYTQTHTLTTRMTRLLTIRSQIAAVLVYNTLNG